MSEDGKLDALIDDAFTSVWPKGDPDIRRYLVPIASKFAQSDCCDSHFFDEFRRGDLGKLASRIWEAMLYVRFQGLGWHVVSKDTGPDFLIDDRIYVEAVAAQPGDADKDGLPQEWQSGGVNAAGMVPTDQVLLRWTSVIKAKRDAYLKYLKQEIVDPKVPFVIAVNACRLGGDTHGVGGVPLAAMAVLPFGSPQAQIDVLTGETVGCWQLAWQDAVLKANGGQIPTDSFLQEEYRCISAIVGCSGFYAFPDNRNKFCGQPPYYVIHNPLANNPLPQPWLPGAIEYAVTGLEAHRLQLTQLAP